ncbi:MAG: response regulator transcription factor [Christensenellaceae bacterium]|nr:response regulator transcription factor [Christensenellaceae bacterium]
MPNKEILIVDDDKNICEVIKLYLQKEGYKVTLAYDGQAGLEAFERSTPSLVVLDIMMPRKDGWEVLKEIRKSSAVPVIMLTAKGETIDKVLGLELGADDYIVKPFDPKEFIARVKAVMRRANMQEEENRQIKYDDLVIDISNYTVTYKGEIVEMPPKEIELLFFLASHPNKVFTREQLLQHVWDFEFFGDSRTVDVHIKRLRKKLYDQGPNWEIKTVWGVGYKFEVR